MSSSMPPSTGSTRQVSTTQHRCIIHTLLHTSPRPCTRFSDSQHTALSTMRSLLLLLLLLLSSEDKLHWDEVSDFLYDALSEQFHVQSETREEERIARLLTTLYTDCIERKDFTGLERMVGARRQVLKGRDEAKRKVKEELAEDDEEDEEEEWDEEDGEMEEGEGGGERGLEGRIERMTVAEGKESEEESKRGQVDDGKEETAEQKAEADDGWTTVGGKQKTKKKGR